MTNPPAAGFPNPAAGRPASTRRRPPLLSKARLLPAAVTISVFGAILVALQVINVVTGYALTSGAGIKPRSLSGLWGILDAPLLHASWGHLASNIVPVMILGFVIVLSGIPQFLSVTILVWLVSGIGVWLTAPGGSVTVGASVLVFGWLTFLVLRGFFARHLGHIVVGLVLLAVWGGIFFGLIPGHAGISWQGHLFGAIAGAVAAVLVARADAPSRSRRSESI